MSRTARVSCLAAATFRRARMASATRPPRPMTLPMSDSATSRWSTWRWPSKSSVTLTWSPCSTRFVAMYSTNSRIWLSSAPAIAAALLLDALRSQQARDDLGRLGALAHPLARLFAVDLDELGLRTRVVLADDVDHGAVPGGAGVSDDDAVIGLLLLANTREPDFQQVPLLAQTSASRLTGRPSGCRRGARSSRTPSSA